MPISSQRLKITVHPYKVFHSAHRRWVIPPKDSFEVRIKRVGGAIIAGIAQEVDASDLDEDGRYDPKRPKSGSVHKKPPSLPTGVFLDLGTRT